MTPTIACFDHATVPLGIDLGTLVRALRKFVDACVAPVRSTPAKLVRSRGFAEMLVDPAINRYVTGANSHGVYAYETAGSP